MYGIETVNLTYLYPNNETVLNGISLQVPVGSIYGFLGPNGAGKTTTLKLVLGLLKKQQGEICILGKPFNDNRIDILRDVGSLIESPSLYGHLSATENLRLLQKVYACPSHQIQKVLTLVGLAGTGTKKTSQFSLGMKQRLGIAIALLHEPSLLILDEPTNGLDPNGIIEIRDLLITLNQQQGITIVISSHLLAEIEKLASCVGVINTGKLLFQGPLGDLVNKRNESRQIVFETNDVGKALEIFSQNDLSGLAEDGKIILPFIPKETVASLIAQLTNQNVAIYEVSITKNDLETIFMNLINN